MPFFSRLVGGGPKKDDAPAKAPVPVPASATSPPPPASSAASSSTQHSLDQISDTLELMEARESKLEKQIEEAKAKAMDLMASDKKDKALNCMRQKKLFEGQLDSLFNQRFNLEQVKFSLEEQALTRRVLDAERNGAKELERLNKLCDAESIEEHVERVREAMLQQQEVRDLLAQSLVEPTVDDDELMSELMADIRQEVKKSETKKHQKQLQQGSPAVSAEDAELERELAALRVPKKQLSPEDQEAELRRLEAELQ